jgi:hypothetical protein
MALISNYIDNNNGVTILWDTGTTANFIALPYVGPGIITLNGNGNTINVSSAPGSIILIGGPSSPVYGNWIIENFTLESNTTPGIYGIQCTYGAHCTLGPGMSFVNPIGGTFVPGSPIQAAFGSNLVVTDGYTVSGNWSSVMEADDFGRIDANSQTIQLLLQPFFATATVVTHGAGAIVSLPGVTFSAPGGIFTGVKKFQASLLSLIDFGGCTGLPGNVAGTPPAGTLGTDGAFCN